MRKSKIITFSLVLVSLAIFSQSYCFGDITVGSIFRIKENHYVPVFNNNVFNLTYKSGPKGSYCEGLDIVLLPASTLQIIEMFENGHVEVEYCVSETVKGRGFVHANFIRNSMEQVKGKFWDVALCHKRLPFTLQKFRKICYRCISEKIPYCGGASNFERINLDNMYFFSEKQGNSLQNGNYELRGFDGFGFLYFVSNGTLFRELYDINMSGEKLFIFDTRREYSLKEKKFALSLMRDSDYILIHRKKKRFGGRSWYVAISFNGGLLEFKGKKHGITFTEKESSVKRLDTLLGMARLAGSDLYIVRWHPELLTLLKTKEAILNRKMPLH
ncbi:MAG: hypothetical protein LBB16_03175 [Puniceicoccales bacterium]|nr:hypothetical protein [Puniceicoccales bacterium]